MPETLLSKASLGGVAVSKVQQLAPTFTAMIYGEAGVGKTLLSATSYDVPDMRNVLLIDAEAGTKTLRNKYPNVDVAAVRTWEEIQGVYNGLFDGGHSYQTIIIDSLTEMQYINLRWIMGEEVDLWDDEKEGWEEYRKSLKTMRKLVRAFRDLQMNTIFTCLAHEGRDDKTKKTTIGPSFSGKFRKEAPGLLDEVYYMYVVDLDEEEAVANNTTPGSHRVLLTTKTETIVAKSRSDLPATVIDPDFKYLYPRLTEEKKAA